MIDRALAVAATLLLTAAPLCAQLEYYELETGRPLRVQSAQAIERYAWEVQVGPGLSVPSSGSSYALESAIAYGVLPRTQLEITMPFVSMPGATGGRSAGLAGLGLGALYNLNAETISLPAFAVAAQVTTTAGSQAPSAPLLSLEGIATRSFTGMRLHLNAAATIGPNDATANGVDRSRWSAGAAIDHAWPIQSLLAAVELFAERPLAPASAVAWSAGAGVRFQATPPLVLDAALSRRFTGDQPAWMATLGVTWSFAVRALMPVQP